MVSIGLLSYSWYLWHWPLISLNRAYHLGARDLAVDGLLALLALLLAWATYRAVEAPIRFHRPWLFADTRGSLWLGAAMSLLMLGAAAVVIEHGKRESARFLAGVGTVGGNDGVPGFDGCSADAKRNVLSAAGACTIGTPTLRSGILAWGDSHIEHWKPLLAEASHDTRFVIRTLNTCPPLLGVVPYKRREGMYGCGYNNESVADEVRKLAFHGSVQGVILGARWNEYLALQETDPGAMLAWALADHWKEMEATGGGSEAVGTPPYDHGGSVAAQAGGLRRTLETLASAGLRVLIIAPVPELYFNGPQCLYRRSADACVVPRVRVEERRRATMASIETARRGMDNNVRVWDPIDEFCDERLCYTQRSGLVMYTDHNHVSPGKAKALLPQLAPHLVWLKDG